MLWIALIGYSLQSKLLFVTVFDLHVHRLSVFSIATYIWYEYETYRTDCMFWDNVCFGTISIFGKIFILAGFKNWDIKKLRKTVILDLMYWDT